MARRYWYVVKSEHGWTVRDGEGRGLLAQLTHFRTQSEAIDHAAHQARNAWLVTKTPSGVRIQSLGALWRDERTYGNDPFPPPG